MGKKKCEFVARCNERNEQNINELRVEGCDENSVKSIPIEAFFYIINTQKGYANAVKYRNNFYAQSGGENIPIVGIKLPTTTDPNVHILVTELQVNLDKCKKEILLNSKQKNIN